MSKDELKNEAEEWVEKEYPTLEITAVAERYCKAYIAGAEPREKRIKELEKENAELKEWQKDTIKARGNDYMDWSRMKDQLTKAKEHIRTLISCLIDWVQEGDKDYYCIADAEQFLKE